MAESLRAGAPAESGHYYSFRNTLLIYVALFLALTFPFWLQGEVIAPHRQAAEIGAPDTIGATNLENRKFGDYFMSYIPEFTGAFDRSQSGWLGTWTARTELGRPVHHTFGLSPAYSPSMLLAAIADSPPRFMTLLSLGTCLAAGLFILLLCREVGLSPLAGLLAGSSLAASPFFMYWLTFPMFTAAYCWAAGALYAVTRIDRKPDFLGWGVLAFCIYSLLMTSYQQLVVFHAYLLAGYGAHLAYKRWRAGGWRSLRVRLVSTSTAILVGTALALPMYADLAFIASESARVAPDPSFFTANWPKLESPTDIVTFVVLGTFPEILGNPISPAYPHVYGGRSVTPLVIFLALVGLLLRPRETWGWWLAIAVLSLLLFVKPLYFLGVKYLGFNVSRTNPTSIMILPVTIIAAQGADALIRRARVGQHAPQILLAAAGAASGVALAIGLCMVQGTAVRWGIVALSLAVLIALAAQVDKARPVLLIGVLVAIGSYISFPRMLRQDPSQIAVTSPLVKSIRENLAAGSRYAAAAPGIGVLPPNLNAALELASIHSTNSLSSRRYHTLIRELGGDVELYGRWNNHIAPDYDGAVFWMSNVSLVLAPSKIEHRNLEYLGTVGPVHLHRVVSRMGCCLQVGIALDGMTADEARIGDPREASPSRPTVTADRGDSIEVDVKPGPESLLIISQKFHRDWHARVLSESGWVPARTLPVNGVFQGVVLPDGARKAKLEFLPYVRFAWVAHVFWILVLPAIAFQAMRARRRQSSGADGAPI